MAAPALRNNRPIGEIVLQACSRLEANSYSASLDAQVLMARILDKNRAWVLAHPEASLSEAHAEAFEVALMRLQNGEPLPYVLGEWEFYGLSFRVTPDVLIPRPETESLVETALDWLKLYPERRAALEVGAGSGCIAVSMATNLPDLHILANDISGEALEVARANVERHHVGEQVSLQQGDLLVGIERKFDLVCANLPYIPSDMLKTLVVNGHEPTLALDGGVEGLDFITRLLEAAPQVLATGGLLLLEIEASQAESAAELARFAFPQAAIVVLPDLASHPRLLVVKT